MKSELIMKGPAELVPIPQCSLGKYIAERLEHHGSRIAQVDAVTGRTSTFADILQKSLNVAKHLRARGIRRGDVVGISSGNSLDYNLPVLATLFLGATCAPLNPTYTTRELQHTMTISKPSIIFCTSTSVDKITSVAQHLKFIKEIVLLDGNSCSKYPLFSSFLKTLPGSLDVVDVNPDTDVAAILCSSGTTGLPKGVMLTHKNILVAIGHMKDFRFGNMKPSAVYLGLLPFFHAYAFITNIITLANGAKLIVMPKFEEHLFLRSIQNHKVSILMLVPPLLVFLAKHPIVDQYDLSSLTEIWCGAAPLSKDVQIQVTDRLGVKCIRQGYGMTETTLGVLLVPSFGNKYGSSGTLVPSTQCKVIDVESGELLGPGKSGELCFRGPLIMKGYCGDIESTAATIDEEGYLHTGDIGYYDSDGYFFIVDRLKELIKYKGYQVPPAELEAVLLLHPLIKDAAVTGIPDDIAGELPIAFVVKQPGANITANEIMKFVSGHVSPQKKLHGGVIFVDSIPKTASGKILRRNLKDLIKSKL